MPAPFLQLFYESSTTSISGGSILALVGAMPPTSAKGEKKMFQQLPILRNRSAGPVLNFRAFLKLLMVGFGLFAVSIGHALGSTTVTGTVGASGKYLVTGAPVMATTVTVLKLSFENQTLGTNLELCAGTAADFAAGTCSIRLSDSGGPGFVFLTITDTSQLSGKIIFVQRAVGFASSHFTLTVE
jgi:hypothetical protein